MALRLARGASFLLDDSGRIVGYVGGAGTERDLAGNPITPGSTPAPAGFLTNQRLWQSAVAASVTGTLTETVLATIPIPAGAMGVNGALRVLWTFSYTNSANNKILKVNLAGTNGWLVTMTTSSVDESGTLIKNRGAANSQLWSRNGSFVGAFLGGGAVVTLPTSSVDMGQAQNLTVTGTLANTGETITLESYSVELLNP